MCDPIMFGTAAAAATGTTAATAATAGLFGVGGAFSIGQTLMTAGSVLSFAGNMQAGSAAAEASRYQAQQSLNEGAYRQDAAKAQAEKIRKAGRAQVGQANAQLAASGVKLGEGSPLEVQKTITQNAEEDALSAILSGKRTMDSAESEASLLGKAGSNAVKNAQFGAASTVLSTGAKMYSNWK